MTTPERLRRRQRFEGVVLILLAIFTMLQALYFSTVDRRVQECFAERFTQLSEVSKIRADLTARETEVTRGVIEVEARAAELVQDDPTQPIPPDHAAQLQEEMVAALLVYQAGIADIQRERKENPVPPYPIGTCEEE